MLSLSHNISWLLRVSMRNHLSFHLASYNVKILNHKGQDHTKMHALKFCLYN